MTFEDFDPLFDAEVKAQVGPFVAACTDLPASSVNRLPAEMAGDAIAVHMHPTRNDMPLMVSNRSSWSWEFAHGSSAKAA